LKVSLNWLKEYVDLSRYDRDVDKIVSKLTMSGLEVEDILNEQEIYKNFVVGYVKEKSKHPNADKLSLCKVSTGEEEFQVICGAPNVEAGQKVVFAPVGTVIPKGNITIGKAKIRGVESFGMICSESELELSDIHEGIMVLSNGVEVGMPITKALELNDVIMEIAITPNRPDALSHIGIARDLAAIFNKELNLPKITLDEKGENLNAAASVEILDLINCPRYVAKVVQNVAIKDSPDWLKNRISKIGLRPINNIVDITNYIMYEYGQPLHAFDLEKLSGRKIVVKSTSEEASFITLDSKQRMLPKNTLMICDADKAVAIAGVMGGENSEISQSTKNILIESAYFNPSSIRRTSRALGLSTESSYRFERGIDYENTAIAAERAAQLISEYADGEIIQGNIDIYPNKISAIEVKLRYERVTELLGYHISNKDINQILEKLGFKIIFESHDEAHLIVPTFRPDVEREADVIEEIARIYGYDKVPPVSRISITLGHKYDDSEFTDGLKDAANAMGFYEMINNPLQNEKAAKLIGNPIKILNPQSLDMEYLRTSLIPGALQVVSHNINNGEKDLLLYEIGNVFNKKTESDISNFEDFTEVQKLIFVVTGRISQKEWHSAEILSNFYNLKGFVESFLIKISLDNVLNDSYYDNANSIYEYNFEKVHENNIVGTGGRIRKEVLNNFDIEQDVYCFEFDISRLISLSKDKKQYKEPVKYPKVIRDCAFIFDKSVTYQQVKGFIEKEGSNLLKSVKIFDLFESDSLGSDKKSMAFSLVYYSEDKTLTEEEIEKVFNSLIAAVTNKFNAKLRGS